MSPSEYELTDDRAGAERPRDAERRVEVPRVERGRQPVAGLVRERDRLVLGVERDRRQDRPEDLLAGDRHVVADVVEDRRRHEVAAGLLERPAAAGHDARAVRPPGLDVAEHLVEMRPLDHRAELRRRIERVADRPAVELRDEPLDQRVVDRPMDDQPRPARAVLAHVHEPGEQDVGGDLVEVGRVGQHDLRALAAALERDFLEVALGRVVEEQAADLGRAGERDHVDVHVPAERRARCRARARARR